MEPPIDKGDAIRQSQILVIDDLEMNRRVLGRHLAKAGFENVDFACDGEQALKMVEKGSYDILLLDIMMPGIDGFEVCKRLRKRPEFASLPVLVQTALDGDDDRSQAFAAGATDVVGKPINGPELIARLHIHLENRHLVRRLTEYHDRLADELEVVQQLQQDLVPGRAALEDFSRLSLDVDARFQPSTEVGGDLWAAHALDDGRLSVIMCDLTGHGVVAAVNAFRLHVLLETHKDEIECPGAFLTLLNEKLARLLPVGTFATAFHAILDPAKGELTYAAAATHTVQLMQPDGSPAEMLEGCGVPLGILPHETYAPVTCPFPPGAILLCYSDALVELEDSAGNPIDNETINGWFARAVEEQEQVIPFIMKNLAVRGVGWLSDDLTIISAKNIPG